MSSFVKVTAIVRMKRFAAVEERLASLGIEGITVSLVKGFGELHPDRYFGFTTAIQRLVGHVRIESFIRADKAEEMVEAIVGAAYTGDPGDGVIATLPVSDLVHIRERGGRGDTASGVSDTEDTP